MKNIFRLFFALLLTTTVTGVSGCGGGSNTVEMPTNPVTAPPSGPLGAETEGAVAQPGLTPPPAPEP